MCNILVQAHKVFEIDIPKYILLNKQLNLQNENRQYYKKEI